MLLKIKRFAKIASLLRIDYDFSTNTQDFYDFRTKIPLNEKLK